MPEIQPRVCGDYTTAYYRTACLCDTTPRLRGLPIWVECFMVLFRYNPAYAGTTDQGKNCCRFLPIQPRVCGDYASSTSMVRVYPDTTPRMRGLLGRATTVLLQRRYNPAYAGTTHQRTEADEIFAIQPRVCGDYALAASSYCSPYDTTPRMRGLLLLHRVTRVMKRYNPAYAGTTVPGYRLAPSRPIQPRVCGDYGAKGRTGLDLRDTTPRMRGLRNE